jgi:hypothetical protein
MQKAAKEFSSDKKENGFSISYYSDVIKNAKSNGYTFMTMHELSVEKVDVKSNKICVLRHDLDDKPQRLMSMAECEEGIGAKSSIFVLVHTNKYNFLSYETLNLLLKLESKGFEIGLHTNFVEVSNICHIEKQKILANELSILRTYFHVTGIACHRNIDYMYNSLPFVEENWESLKEQNELGYQAYDKTLIRDLVFVNEGFLPHLGWRSRSPEDVINAGESFCLSTHPHWWHHKHAFEN